jgi:hypothetical protein
LEVLDRLLAIDECKLILIYVPDVVLDLFQVIHLPFGYLNLFDHIYQEMDSNRSFVVLIMKINSGTYYKKDQTITSRTVFDSWHRAMREFNSSIWGICPHTATGGPKDFLD